MEEPGAGPVRLRGRDAIGARKRRSRATEANAICAASKNPSTPINQQNLCRQCWDMGCMDTRAGQVVPAC